MSDLVKYKQVGLVKIAPGERITAPVLASTYKTAMEFAKDNTPVAVAVRNAENTSLAVCINSPECSLASIRGAFDLDATLAYLEIWLIDLVSFFNVKRSMTDAQIRQTALLMFQEAYFLNLAEFSLFVSLMKKGKFGALYSELDGATILRCLDIFVSDRMAEAEQQSYLEHDKAKQDRYERSGKLQDIEQLKKDAEYENFKRSIKRSKATE